MLRVSLETIQGKRRPVMSSRARVASVTRPYRTPRAARKMAELVRASGGRARLVRVPGDYRMVAVAYRFGRVFDA